MNAPLGRTSDQIALAALTGHPTDYQSSLGFTTQYGIETYWKIGVVEGLNLTPSLQLLKNLDGELETVIGIRLKLQRDFTS